MRRIEIIDIKHFKVFRDTEPITLNSNNLLLYGPNGSGKSSIYWALYTFLQSSEKTLEEVNKYFDPHNKENLINTFSKENGEQASITLTLADDTDAQETIRLAFDNHYTANPEIRKANLASDFISYRVLFRFYHFTNRQIIDLFPVFEREVLPFCSTAGCPNLGNAWQELEYRDPLETNRKKKYRGVNAGRTYEKYNKELTEFSTNLSEVLMEISKTAQEFYTNHFQIEGESELHFNLYVDRKAEYIWGNEHKLIRPQIGLELKIGDALIPKPQTYMNEAKLTQIAISIRLGATKAHQYEFPLKILVLDDLLISLDMSNRMQVINVILSDPDFASYQKIVMTHDRGFFDEVRRQIRTSNDEWICKRLSIRSGDHLNIEDVHDELEYAEMLLEQGRLDETAVMLRKSVEDTLRSFVEKYPNTGNYKPLAKRLSKVKDKLAIDALSRLSNLISDPDIDEKLLNLIIPDNNDDLIENGSIDEELRRRSIEKRNNLRELISATKGKEVRALKVIDQIAHVKDRVLNPGAHAGSEPLFEKEIQDALVLVGELRELLHDND